MILFVTFLLTWTGFHVLGESTAVVETSTGPVRGEFLKTSVNSIDYASFKGIRFAEAPNQRQRFKPPIPAEPWVEVFEATAEANKCPQYDLKTLQVTGDEDCLFLSVFTPVTNLESPPEMLKAVIVFVYGGGFQTGSSNTATQGPDFMIERDLVFVAMNYRVGAFGFLSLDHPDATGNAGLKDQRLALEWVQANVEKFGGDPNNVTLLGESAGSVSVNCHVLSEGSKGLFHRAIMASGVALNPWGFVSRSQAELVGRQVGAVLGSFSTDKSEILDTLYAASVEDLVATTSFLYPQPIPFTPTSEDPTIATDPVLTDCPLNYYKTGRFNKVPHLLGFVDQETLYFITNKAQFLGILDFAATMVPWRRDWFTLYEAAVNAANNIVEDIEFDILEAMINETTDRTFKTQIDQTQMLLATYNNGQPTYYYDFTFVTNTSTHIVIAEMFNQGETLLGAAHRDDTPFFLHSEVGSYNFDTDSAIGRTVHRVSTLWANFAKFGNPTPAWLQDELINITWPDSGVLGLALEIGDELRVVPRPINEDVKNLELYSYPVLEINNGCF